MDIDLAGLKLLVEDWWSKHQQLPPGITVRVELNLDSAVTEIKIDVNKNPLHKSFIEWCRSPSAEKLTKGNGGTLVKLHHILSTADYDCSKQFHEITISDFLMTFPAPTDFMLIPNIGKNSVEVVRSFLKYMGCTDPYWIN